MKKDLRGTWKQALFSFFLPIFLVLVVRWVFVEPYVIPSGSMLPTLKIHDHIFVNKLAYGVQNPIKESVAFAWSQPARGDVIVFRFPENPKIFYVKRVIGLPGETIEVRQGKVYINDKALDVSLDPNSQDFKDEDFMNFEYFTEKSAQDYSVRYQDFLGSSFGPITVKADEVFVFGDNRDQSHDSRFWGGVPLTMLIGKAQRIWLSCDQTLASVPFLCDPSTIRWNRFLKKVR